MIHEFGVPVWFDLVATGLFAITGAAVGIQRGFDPVGVYALAFATGVGGGILRDSVFLHEGMPAALRDGRYPATILLATVFAALFRRASTSLDVEHSWFAFVDAVGLGLFAATGVQKSLDVHAGALAAIIVGVLNAVGGGVVRDVLAQRPPLLFQPSQVYGLAALAGCSIFVALDTWTPVHGSNAGYCAVVVTVVIRMLAVRFDWRTRALTIAEGEVEIARKMDG